MNHAENVGEDKTILHKGPGISGSNADGAKNAHAGQGVRVIHWPSGDTDIRPRERGCGGCMAAGPDIAKASFIETRAIECVGVGDGKDAVAGVVGANESGDISRRVDAISRESDGFRVVRKEESGGDFTFGRNQIVGIGGELVLIKFAGLRENRETLGGEWRAGIDSLWSRDKKATVWQLQIKQSQSRRIDIRAIRIDGRASQCPAHAAEKPAERRG